MVQGHSLTIPGYGDNRRVIYHSTRHFKDVGLPAWVRYNFKAFQHFEGDYVEFDSLHAIKDGVLALAGKTRNGARFEDERDLMVQVFYDPPPHPLTKGQVSR